MVILNFSFYCLHFPFVRITRACHCSLLGIKTTHKHTHRCTCTRMHTHTRDQLVKHWKLSTEILTEKFIDCFLHLLFSLLTVSQLNTKSVIYQKKYVFQGSKYFMRNQIVMQGDVQNTESDDSSWLYPWKYGYGFYISSQEKVGLEIDLKSTTLWKLCIWETHHLFAVTMKAKDNCVEMENTRSNIPDKKNVHDWWQCW